MLNLVYLWWLLRAAKNMRSLLYGQVKSAVGLVAGNGGPFIKIAAKGEATMPEFMVTQSKERLGGFGA
jgi:hypothetical protein